MKKRSALEEQILELSDQLVLKLNKLFDLKMPKIQFLFDLKGQAAGQAVFRNGSFSIRYNSLLLEQNPEHFFQQTVAHEIAHVATRHVYGNKAKPHGQEWKNFMLALGYKPERCHQLDVSTEQTKNYRKITYTCKCQEYQLTLIRHNRIQKGMNYYCRRCKQPLKLVAS